MNEGVEKIKLDNSGESQIFFSIEGESVFFRKERSGKIVLADADSGEPTLSGTNQYLRFDSLDDAQKWLDKNK